MLLSAIITINSAIITIFNSCLKLPFSFGRVDRTGLIHGEEKGAPGCHHGGLTLLSPQQMHLGILIHGGIGWAYETWGGGGRLGIPAGAAIGACVSWCRSLLLAGFGVDRVAGVKHHCHGLHSRHSVQAALPGWVEPGGLELQLIIARHFDERTPAKGSLEASSKSEKWATGRKSHAFKRKFLSTATESPL